MKSSMLIGIVGAALGAIPAAATAQVGYRLQPGSTFTEVYCLPPCACPFHQTVGPMTGTFTLTLNHLDPLFRYYDITMALWSADLEQPATPVVGSGTYQIGGEVAIQQRIELDLAVGIDIVRHYDSGLVAADPANPFPRIGISASTAQFVCRRNDLHLVAAPGGCYSDCDGSGSLNINDFICFQQRFAAGDPYANCDSSTTPPVLNVNDFICFQGRFAAGCQ